MGYCKQFDELFEADSDHAAAVAAVAAGRYTFMCRQDDNAPLPPVPDWYDLFHVNVLAYYKNLENDVLVLRSDDSFHMPREFFLERRELLEIVFVSTLYYVDIPRAVVESIFDEVIRLACSMVLNDGNNVVHRQVLPMTVEIVISENEEEMSARTLRDSRVDEAFPFPLLPEMHHEAVGEWAISQVTGGLEKVALESCSVKPRCAICLDTILVGNRMPCSHIYHGYCIYRWLRKSNSCPLCHFAMLRN
ncbi:putative RING-H2 finger protein ATL19 [Rhododendron vialii]|uniref:putative RING-H2 finger protein ATL19 n=1 Tax=Rhododendron vialii TaxID=182163 RepID=UPI00265EB2A8|nr:putative RING-H2 finger protein ATL19 [Rhododendron vialii]